MFKVTIVGGCGHVGLPLGLKLAEKGCTVFALDINTELVSKVNSGEMPFFEEGADTVLQKVLSDGGFVATTDSSVILNSNYIIIVIGTPLNEHSNPDPMVVVETITKCAEYFNNEQLIVLRSTVYPGTTHKIEQLLKELKIGTKVVFAPERILEGKALSELETLPQVIGARNKESLDKAKKLFELFGVEILHSTPEEAEIIKLISNSWRYIKFATANQFWMMCNEAGLDYSKILNLLTKDYPRAFDLPQAGFAAGPCLHKDTVQMGAFSNLGFALGAAAVQINEGQPFYIIEKLSKKYQLSELIVGILGMSFKPESDDSRSSLSYKLKKILEFKARKVFTTDPYIKDDPELLPLEYVINESDLLIIGTPHNSYKNLIIPKPVFDLTNLRGLGNLI